MECTELAVFRLKPDAENRFFEELEPAIQAELQERFSGLLTTPTYRLLDQERTYAHVWRWASKEEALRAAKEMPTLPSAKGFMEAIEEVVMMTHLEEKG